MHPNTLLAYLITGATIVGAKLYVDHGIADGTSNQSSEQFTQLKKELEILKTENETLKMIQSEGGEIVLPLKLYTYVEKNLGLEFSPHVKAFSSSEDKLAEAVEYRWVSQFSDEGMNKRNYAFQLLGLLPVNQNYSKQLALAEANGAIGIYDANAKELLLSNRYDPENVFHQASLIRLLSIALLEEHYPCQQNLTDDAFISRDAVIRGRASMVSHRFQNNYARSGHIKSGSDTMNTEVIELFQSLPTLVQGITTFPVKHGKGYVEQLTLHHDEVFPELFKTPPSSTAQVYANTLPKNTTSPDVNDPTQLLKTTLGQAITSFYIQRFKVDGIKLHTKLLDDELTLKQNPANFTAKWTTTWNNEASATEFHKIANEVSSSMEIPCDVLLKGKLVTLSQSVTK